MRLFRQWRIRPKRRSAAGKKKWYKEKDFLALRKEWYAKAKKSGFDDLEYTNWETGNPSPFVTRNSTADLARKYKPAVARYYELAAQFLWELRDKYAARYEEREGEWFSPEYIRIWEYHSEGFTGEQIAKKVGLHFDTVQKRLHEMKPAFEAYCRQKALWDEEDSVEET